MHLLICKVLVNNLNLVVYNYILHYNNFSGHCGIYCPLNITLLPPIFILGSLRFDDAPVYDAASND